MLWLMAPIGAILGYLLGSIPVGVWVCQLYGVDIRKVGSGRTGGTNAWRAAGLKAAIPTVLGDALKGAVAIWLITWLFNLFVPEPTTMTIDEAVARESALRLAQSLAGGFAVIGHIWSFLLGFKGGAGGITGAATTMALYSCGRDGLAHWDFPLLVEPHGFDCHLCRGGKYLFDLPHIGCG